MKTAEKESPREDVEESTSDKHSNLDHFKEQFEELSIKDLRLVQQMVSTTLDLKQAKARHEGKVKKEKKGNSMVMPSDMRYAEPDEDYI